jgi:hypothetical protein
MEKFIVFTIVSVVVVWACRSSYRFFSGKSGGCNCAGGCKKYDDMNLTCNNNKD